MELAYSQEGPDYVVRHGDGIVFRFSRLHESHEDVSAICRVSLSGFVGRSDGDLFDGRLILTGPRSKADCVKACRDRLPEFADWYALIERGCQLVRRALEEGTPIVDLSEVPESTEAEYVLPPLFRTGEHALVFGDGGTGKSTLALAWATQIGGRVLYLDYEDDESNMARRLRGLAAGLELDGCPHVFYKRAETSVPMMTDALSRQIAQEHIDGMIVDSAGLACGQEPETADSANAYFRGLRVMRLRWSITIAHQPKGKEKSPLPFGSVFWWNNPRTIWQTQKAQEPGEDELHVGLWHRKANNSKLQKPVGYRVAFREGAISVLPELPRSVVEHRPKLPANERILAILEERPGVVLTYKEIGELAEIPEHTVIVTMQRHGAQYRREGEGWRLAFDY